MCALPGPGGQGKRKEIYKYEAPWTVYSMNWSIRPDKRFRLALGSFVEEYNNKVINPSLMVHWKKTEDRTILFNSESYKNGHKIMNWIFLKIVQWVIAKTVHSIE